MNNTCEEIKKHINRIKGQVGGIEKMINEGRDSDEIIQQISAVRSALSRLGVEILKEESGTCFKEGKKEQKIQKFEQLVTSFFKIT